MVQTTQELEQVNRWLETTPSEQESRRRVQRMETEIQGLQNRIALLETEIKADGVMPFWCLLLLPQVLLISLSRPLRLVLLSMSNS